MGTRPRTKLRKDRKLKRCPKCGRIVYLARRCKRCSSKLIA